MTDEKIIQEEEIMLQEDVLNPQEEEATPKEAAPKETAPKRKTRKRGVRSFLGGGLLASERVLKHLPFAFFLVFLGILMITNRYWSQRTIRQMEIVQDSIKELKAQSVTFETELMKINRPSEIVERVRQSGLELHEPVVPARKLRVKKEEQKTQDVPK